MLLKRWRDRAGLLGSPGCLSRLSCFSISHYCSPWPSSPPSMANIVRILFREVKFLIAFQTNIFSRYFLIKKSYQIKPYSLLIFPGTLRNWWESTGLVVLTIACICQEQHQQPEIGIKHVYSLSSNISKWAAWIIFLSWMSILSKTHIFRNNIRLLPYNTLHSFYVEMLLFAGAK